MKMHVLTTGFRYSAGASLESVTETESETFRGTRYCCIAILASVSVEIEIKRLCVAWRKKMLDPILLVWRTGYTI